MLDRDLLVIDLETSGRNPDTCSIIQIGSLVVDRTNFTVSKLFNIYIRPYTDVWEDEAQDIHKITQGYINQVGTELGMALDGLETTIGDTKKICLAAWSNGWDMQCLRRAYEKLGISYPFPYRSLDIASFVRLLLRAYGMTKRDKVGLQNCAKALNIDTSTYAQHDAYHDASLTARVLVECLRLIENQRSLVKILAATMKV